MQKIKDYYIQREGKSEFQKRVIKEVADKPKMEVGEILHFPKFEDVVYTEKQTEFMRLALEKLKKERLNLLFSGYAYFFNNTLDTYNNI